MAAIASVQCPRCGARLPERAYVCPQCGGDIAMFFEDTRNGRIFLLLMAGSMLGGIAAFTGAMFYVGIVDTYRLVIGAWGFTTLVVLGLMALAGRLGAALRTREQLAVTEQGEQARDRRDEHQN